MYLDTAATRLRRRVFLHLHEACQIPRGGGYFSIRRVRI
jgi:hypothetical protein